MISFFKHQARDDAGNPNPLAIPGKTALAVFESSSQSGRSMRTFLHLGFNEDEQGRVVFEGAFPHIGGGRLPLNTRFSAPGRAWGYTVDHVYPAYEFLFSYLPTHDPITGRTDGILLRCLKSNTCPKIFHVATALEIWEGRQSLGSRIRPASATWGSPDSSVATSWRARSTARRDTGPPAARPSATASSSRTRTRRLRPCARSGLRSPPG